MLEELKKYGFLQAVVIVAVIGGVLFMANAFSTDKPSTTYDKKPQTTSTHDEKHTDEEEVDLKEGKVADGVVSIKALYGDSQTLIARRTIQDYAESNKVKLSPAEIVYIETNIVDLLGNDDTIDVGDAVQIQLDSIDRFMNQAEHLSQAQLAVWDAYAQNTNLV